MRNGTKNGDFIPSRSNMRGNVFRGRRRALVLLAAVAAAAGCTPDGSGENGATTASPGVTAEANDGGRGGEAQHERPLECPTITPDFDSGRLTASATAVGEVSTNDFFGLTVEVNGSGTIESTAWFEQFREDGTADITIPEQVMDRVNNSPGSHTRVSVARVNDIAPPAETLTPEGMQGADALVALNEAVAEANLSERVDEFPEQQVCGGATWDGQTWHADRTEGAGLGDVTDNPFAPFPDTTSQD